MLLVLLQFQILLKKQLKYYNSNLCLKQTLIASESFCSSRLYPELCCSIELLLIALTGSEVLVCDDDWLW